MFESQIICLLQSQHVDDIPKKLERAKIDASTEIQWVFHDGLRYMLHICQTREKKDCKSRKGPKLWNDFLSSTMATSAEIS